MLTKQHCFATNIISPEERRIYQAHMCGLCHTLGDTYGLLARLVTNHDMILLNMLTSAQQEECGTTERRCPLNPLVKQPVSQGVASQFAAAAAIGLARVSLSDSVRDSNGWDLGARLLGSILDTPYQAALCMLDALGFRTSCLIGLEETQAAAERDTDHDPSEPSAHASAALFATTARLAGRPHNEEALSRIGASYGTYLYLKDALRDYPRDMARGEYNPLRRFSVQAGNQLVLSQKGLAWALTRLEETLAAVKENAAQLDLRHKATLAKLLCEPIAQTASNVSRKVASNADGLVFKQWQIADALQAVTFSLPIAVTAGLSAAGYDGCDLVRANELGTLVAADGEGGVGAGILSTIVCCGILICLGQSTGRGRIEGNTIRSETMCDCCGDMACG